MTQFAARLTPARLRFSWGYRDGAIAAHGRYAPQWSTQGHAHFDHVYEAGYWEGRATQDPESTVSLASAWKVFSITA